MVHLEDFFEEGFEVIIIFGVVGVASHGGVGVHVSGHADLEKSNLVIFREGGKIFII